MGEVIVSRTEEVSACEATTNNRNERWEVVTDPTGTTYQDRWDRAKAVL